MIKNKTVLAWSELLLGILLILLSIYTFASPSTALAGVTFAYGVLALITGIVDIIFYVKLDKRTGFSASLSLLCCILSIIVAILIMCNIAAGEFVLIVLFPIWFIAHCVAHLTHLSYIRRFAGTGYYYFTLIVNILGLILGCLMIFDPFISFLSVSYLIGTYLLFLGIDSLIFGLNLLD